MIENGLLDKVKNAASVEELLRIAKENGMEMKEDEAEDYFAALNKAGELSDDELDSVSGGACHIKVDGTKYTVVTSGLKCFTGMYRETTINARTTSEMRADWYTFSSKGCCGKCEYLLLQHGIGFCSKSNR